jgi:hypothetical protein
MPCKLPNHDVLAILRTAIESARLVKSAPGIIEAIAIESIPAVYGRSALADLCDTIRWEGRFIQAADPLTVVQVPRQTIKRGICGVATASDKDVRDALIQRWGGKDAVRKTTKKDPRPPGPLAAVTSDAWAALALAVHVFDGMAELRGQAPGRVAA